MTVVNRMTRLFKADVHGILDKIEEPELVLRQAIREMEEELEREELAIKRGAEQLEQLTKRRERLAARFAEYNDQLETCLSADKQDLAKGVIRKKLEDESLDAALAIRIEEATKALEQSQADHSQRKDQLASIRQKAELLVAQKPVAKSGEAVRMEVTDDEVEIALMREIEKRKGSRGSKRGGAS